MKRRIYTDMLRWKKSPYRKPLVLQGARQVGKTYILTEFGKNEYENTVRFDCAKDPRLHDLFSHGFRVDRILTQMEVLSGERILPGKTLIFIDEIGDEPLALEALKYFCEDAPEYHIAVAGSLLGLAIHSGASYPVGKTDELFLYPLSFEEFLAARHGDAAEKQLIATPFEELSAMKSFFVECLREYYFTGGMPEVVQGLLNGRPYEELRNIQKQILADYSLDISKHARPAVLGRIHQVWNSVPQQLAKSNKKFIYGDIQKGARAKDFELAIQWLLDAGIIYKISRVRKPGLPLKFSEDFSGFKLFLLDHGLMGAMVDAPVADLLIKENPFEEFKGTFTEQYVLEQLIAEGIPVFYFDSDSSKLELDFLIQIGSRLIPVEVKAEENLQSKSLRQFKLNCPDSLPVRVSMTDYREQENLINLPLYAVGRIAEASELRTGKNEKIQAPDWPS